MLRHALIAAAWLVSSGAFAAPGEIADPAGDVLGLDPVQLDVSRMSARVAEGELVLALYYAGAGSPSGLIEIDTDPAAVSGRPSVVSMLCPSRTGLDPDVLIDLFSWSPGNGSVPLVDADLNPVGNVPVQSAPGSLVVRIPLDMLGGHSLVHTAAALGTSLELTDCVPNGGFLASAVAKAPPPAPIPAAGRALLVLMALLMAGLAARRFYSASI